jgi:hypothetical protein
MRFAVKLDAFEPAPIESVRPSRQHAEHVRATFGLSSYDVRTESAAQIIEMRMVA